MKRLFYILLLLCLSTTISAEDNQDVVNAFGVAEHGNCRMYDNYNISNIYLFAEDSFTADAREKLINKYNKRANTQKIIAWICTSIGVCWSSLLAASFIALANIEGQGGDLPFVVILAISAPLVVFEAVSIPLFINSRKNRKRAKTLSVNVAVLPATTHIGIPARCLAPGIGVAINF